MLSVFRPSQSRSLESAAARLVVDAVDASSGRRTAAGGARAHDRRRAEALALVRGEPDRWVVRRHRRRLEAQPLLLGGPEVAESGANASASQRAPVGCAPTQPAQTVPSGPDVHLEGSLGSPCSHRSGSASNAVSVYW